jgi:hypothetical protein
MVHGRNGCSSVAEKLVTIIIDVRCGTNQKSLDPIHKLNQFVLMKCSMKSSSNASRLFKPFKEDAGLVIVFLIRVPKIPS